MLFNCVLGRLATKTGEYPFSLSLHVLFTLLRFSHSHINKLRVYFLTALKVKRWKNRNNEQRMDTQIAIPCSSRYLLLLQTSYTAKDSCLIFSIASNFQWWGRRVRLPQSPLFWCHGLSFIPFLLINITSFPIKSFIAPFVASSQPSTASSGLFWLACVVLED